MAVSRYDVNGTKTGVNLKYEQKRASTAITENTLVTRHTDGRITPAVNTSTFVLGVAVERVTSANADFAATSVIGYDAAREGEEFIMDVDDGGTVGFQAGVARSLINAGTIKAAAPSGGDVATVRVKKVLPNNQAIVTLITETL